MALGVPFGNYRLVRRIARGGMAEVFLAWQLSPSLAGGGDESDIFQERTTGIRFTRQVAIKRILPHLSESDEFRALFLQEARLAATLSHPNVVHIYDFGRSGDCLFLAMELIEGVTLAQLPPLPIEHAVRVAADALAGLHHAHTRTDAAGRPLHIVHRDVSPTNLMITYDGVVKVLDFGIAKAAWSAHETRPGVVRGKYAYMSTEQAEGLRLDGRSDVYAIGVCLFEALAGAPPLPRDLPLDAALHAVRTGAALEGLGQLELLRPDVPPELHSILRRALQPRREHRYGSAAEMQLDLERFLKEWPRLGSALMLGEHVRQQARQRPDVAGEGGRGEVTPVMGTAAPDLAEESESGPLPLDPGTAQVRGPAGPADETWVGGADETLVSGGEVVTRISGPGRGPAITQLLPTLEEAPTLEGAPQGGMVTVLTTLLPEQSQGRGDRRPLLSQQADTGRVKVRGLTLRRLVLRGRALWRGPDRGWLVLGGAGVLGLLLLLGLVLWRGCQGGEAALAQGGPRGESGAKICWSRGLPAP